MTSTSEMDERRARLSADKRALLEKRLRGISAGAAASPKPRPEPPPAAAEAGLGRELAVPPDTPSPLPPGLWPALVEAGEREARQRSAAPDLLADAALEPRLDEQSAAFLSAAFRRMGLFQQAGEAWTIDGLIAERGILPKYRKVLRRWMMALEEEGLVVPEGEAWKAREPVPPPDLDARITAEQREYYGRNLPAVLTGETHPLEFYLPGGSSASVESSYRDLPIFRYCNGVAAAVLEAQVRALPPGARLRVLEVGAGTGGTTASLLPLLDPERTVYHFTDVSKFFTDLGQQKFQQYPFLRFRVLDIERDPVAQGYPAASFDWIVAAHVLHATHRVAETLEHVRRLLAPGGVLLLLEETRFQRKYNFSMGFLPGFDDFEDHGLRPLHPLLSSAQWREALHAAGFTGFATFTEPGSAAEVLGVDVMVARLPERGPAPASFGQRRLWRLAARQPSTLAYNVYYALLLRGPLSVPALARSVRAVAARHEALHTRFAEEGEQITAVADRELLPSGLPVIDLGGLPDAATRESAGMRIVAELASPPFDLARGPLLRTALVRATPGEHSLLFAVHHAVIDGWSLALITRDLADAYEACAAGRDPSWPEAAPQSADFSRWQLRRVREGALAGDLDWWRRHLAGAPPQGIAWRARPQARGGRAALQLPPELTQAVKGLAQRERVTLFITLLAGLNVLLHHWTGQDDLIVGTPVALRGRPEAAGIAGFLLNLLPLRTGLSGDPTFLDLLHRVRDTVLGALAHREPPFEWLAEELLPARSSEELPWVRVLFNMPSGEAGHAEPLRAGGVEVEPLLTGEMGSEPDWTFYARELAGGIRLDLGYNADLLAPGEAARLLQGLADLLAEVTAHPGRRLSELGPVLAARDRLEIGET